METAIALFFLFIMCAAAAMLVHSISRLMLGPRANGYPAAIAILAFTVSPWWLAGFGGLAGHLLSVWVWNTLAHKNPRTA